jgi:hypothetical protein
MTKLCDIELLGNLNKHNIFVIGTTKSLIRHNHKGRYKNNLVK